MNTSEIKTIEIKLIQAYDVTTESKAFTSFDEIIASINLLLESMSGKTVYINNISHSMAVEIAAKYDAELRNGVSGGCYGARDGKQYDGFTLWLPLDHAQRYVETYEGDCDPIVILNPLHQIESYGGELLDLSEEEIEGFLNVGEEIGLDIHHDNTYNHEFDGCGYITDFDFKTIGDYENNKNILIAKFHCGGDIRGNYTRWFAFKFDNTDDLYSILLPYAEIENADEIKEKARLIALDPADKELLERELKELIEQV